MFSRKKCSIITENGLLPLCEQAASRLWQLLCTFCEVFYLQLDAKRRPQVQRKRQAISSRVYEAESRFISSLPFELTSDQIKVGPVLHLLSIDYGNASVTSNIGQMSEGKYDYDLVVSYNSSFE